jgi:predicted transcriptional regulator
MPPSLDEKLREIAFHNRISKNELMRCAFQAFVAQEPEQQAEMIRHYNKDSQNEPVQVLSATT